MLNPVIQEESTGCGIAATACILGKSYPEMKAIANSMGIHASDTSLWSDTQYVRRMLAQAGLETSPQESPFISWESLPDLALLAIKHHQENGKDFWHWVVFSREQGQPRVLDSASYLTSNTRTDFDVMQPKWYIQVGLPELKTEKQAMSDKVLFHSTAPQRIHIFGASGSGVSTLGASLSKAIGGRHLDTDAYYWHKTNPPFTQKREPSERIAMIESDVQGAKNWVLSGSLCSWGEPLLQYFTLAVFLYLDPKVRMARIAAREQARYGTRILPGADMHEQHLAFMEWSASYDTAQAPTRSLDLHETWMQYLPCPVIRLNSDSPIEALCSQLLSQIPN